MKLIGPGYIDYSQEKHIAARIIESLPYLWGLSEIGDGDANIVGIATA